jgi:hypothetical protein
MYTSDYENTLHPDSPFKRDHCKRYDEMWDHNFHDIWSDLQLESAFTLMLEINSLTCLSWIGLEVSLPEELNQKLHHKFCPVIYPFYGLLSPSRRSFYAYFIEKEVRDHNLHGPDFSDVFQFNDHNCFVERVSIGDRTVRDWDGNIHYETKWELNVRCAAGEQPFPIRVNRHAVHVVPFDQHLPESHCIADRIPITTGKVMNGCAPQKRPLHVMPYVAMQDY